MTVMRPQIFPCLIALLLVLALGWCSPTALAENQGSMLFETHCSGCHLNGGNIIRRGKNLKIKALEKNGYDTPEAIADIITNGKNNMSAFSDRLNATDITELSTYVLGQAQQGWP
jgi:cytochrome c6